MARTYKYLDADDKKAVESSVAERDRDAAPAVDDALVAAWEADHYAHSLLARNAATAEDRKEHEEAMKAIEDALANAGR